MFKSQPKLLQSSEFDIKFDQTKFSLLKGNLVTTHFNRFQFDILCHKNKLSLNFELNWIGITFNSHPKAQFLLPSKTIHQRHQNCLNGAV